MGNVFTSRISLAAVFLLVAGCQSGVGIAPSSGPRSQIGPQSCERSCNGQYDACMDRGSTSAGPSGMGGHMDGGSLAADPGDVCPDQLKTCLKRCMP
jgi:hypothetical protein